MKCRPDYVFSEKADRCVIATVCNLKYCEKFLRLTIFYYFYFCPFREQSQQLSDRLLEHFCHLNHRKRTNTQGKNKHLQKTYMYT